jgi:hypothetical protein
LVGEKVPAKMDVDYKSVDLLGNQHAMFHVGELFPGFVVESKQNRLQHSVALPDSKWKKLILCHQSQLASEKLVQLIAAQCKFTLSDCQ